MIIDQAVYRDGRRLPVGDMREELRSLRHEDDGFIWVGFKDPTPDEFALMASEFDLHELAVEDATARGERQRPKFEIYGESAFVVLRTLRYIESTSDIETGELMIFIGDRFVVTVRTGEPAALEKVRTRLEHEPEQLKQGPVSVLHAVMDRVVDNYLVIDREVAEDLMHIEQRVFSLGGEVNVEQIYELKREILEARRAVQPLIEPLRRLLSSRFVTSDYVPFFRDVQDHLLVAAEHIDSYDHLISDILSAHLTQVSVRQNDDMRKMSAWVAIATVPTMCAGLYGMNFHSMPELEASVHIGHSEFYYGYYVLLCVLVCICIGLWRAFKRSGWL